MALRSPPLLAEAAALLRVVHGGPPIAAVSDWYRVPQDYASTARAHDVDVVGGEGEEAPKPGAMAKVTVSEAFPQKNWATQAMQEHRVGPWA